MIPRRCRLADSVFSDRGSQFRTPKKSRAPVARSPSGHLDVSTTSTGEQFHRGRQKPPKQQGWTTPGRAVPPPSRHDVTETRPSAISRHGQRTPAGWCRTLRPALRGRRGGPERSRRARRALAGRSDEAASPPAIQPDSDSSRSEIAARSAPAIRYCLTRSRSPSAHATNSSHTSLPRPTDHRRGSSLFNSSG
jgi:hypothetical protein